MFEVSHFGLMVLFTVVGAVLFGGITFMIWVAFKITAMVAEAQRLTRAVGALVIQEEDKTRQLFPR